MPRVSVKRVAGKSQTQDRKMRARAAKGTADSFQNFALGLGIGAGNTSSFNGYGFNPKSRERVELEWMYRGAWMAGAAIDVIADDMTRAGVEFAGQLKPDQVKDIEERATTLNIWNRLNQTIKWSRLYGGAIAVLLIDGQDYSNPLRIQTVGKDQFKGLLVFDRWMIQPSLEDLVTEIGPDLGTPKYYEVFSNAPALRGMKIHHSRCLRLIGDELPYQQALVENLWGMSVLERPFDRISYFDAATTGASQLIHKAYLRYFKIEKYRDIMGGMGGEQASRGLLAMVQNMRMMASNEGITLIDAKDDMVTAAAANLTGMSDVLLQLAQQLAGAFQIPLVRLLGQSPAGLNSSGESELKTYYDGILQRQVLHLLVVITKIYRCIAQSLRIDVADGFGVTFRPLWQMTEVQKSEVAERDTATAINVLETGKISDKTFLEELQSIGRRTGRLTVISDKEISAADDEVLPKAEDMPLPEVGLPKAGLPKEEVDADKAA